MVIKMRELWQVGNRDVIGVILCLSGMPASGKDSVSASLHELDQRLVIFTKHRGADDGGKAGYINISKEQFEYKRDAGDFVQCHERYGRYYGVDRKVLRKLLGQGFIPIVHIGRIENFHLLRENIGAMDGCFCIIHVQLWESHESLKDRIVQRDKSPAEIEQRLEAMEQEFLDLDITMRGYECPFDLVIRNTDIDSTCHKILSAINGVRLLDDGTQELRDYLQSLKK